MHEVGTPLSYDVCLVVLSIRMLPQFAIAQRQITTPTAEGGGTRYTVTRSRLSALPRHLITCTLTYSYNEIHCFIECLNY